LDYDFCTGAKGGMDVKKDGHIVPYHELCMGHDMFRRVFECLDPRPPRVGKNLVQYALEWYKDHPDLGEPPPTVVNWEMGTPVGVWGGSCMCPDGHVYQVGDEGNMCQSLACDGGTPGNCINGEGGWSFRKVTCVAPAPRPTTSANVEINDDTTAGVWGGTCTCPDGQVYLAGDENNACGSLACEGGVAGICNHYVSVWAHRRIKCYEGPLAPPNSPSNSPPQSSGHGLQKLPTGHPSHSPSTPFSLRIPPPATMTAMGTPRPGIAAGTSVAAAIEAAVAAARAQVEGSNTASAANPPEVKNKPTIALHVETCTRDGVDRYSPASHGACCNAQCHEPRPKSDPYYKIFPRVTMCRAVCARGTEVSATVTASLLGAPSPPTALIPPPLNSLVLSSAAGAPISGGAPEARASEVAATAAAVKDAPPSASTGAASPELEVLRIPLKEVLLAALGIGLLLATLGFICTGVYDYTRALPDEDDEGDSAYGDTPVRRAHTRGMGSRLARLPGMGDSRSVGNGAPITSEIKMHNGDMWEHASHVSL